MAIMVSRGEKVAGGGGGSELHTDNFTSVREPERKWLTRKDGASENNININESNAEIGRDEVYRGKVSNKWLAKPCSEVECDVRSQMRTERNGKNPGLGEPGGHF
ncbi:hypothetical protein ZHAS_00007388 [Anopheles sinensis]|uniref:Uncharacterized protein n=1 Tax=Anopheles sinensis TaxID=74873 RepID=A0A084VPV5_ANOSI|nr:hypothetical protein ZHAS_00007388 [Anopheles sinensis]